MTTLITGGTGRTALALAHLLHAAQRPLVIATRAGTAPAPYPAVHFDWYNTDTHAAALSWTSKDDNVAPSSSSSSSSSKIDRVYIVKPPITTDAAVVTAFVDRAISMGVTRFVLLSSTQVAPDPTAVTPGSVIHQHLVDSGVDYAVLRPTWFMQNFEANFGTSIREQDRIFSATQDGRIPWVSTDDIAQAAFACLTAAQSPNKDIFVVGPELLSYEDAAAIASTVLERPIRFQRYTLEEQAAFYVSLKWDPTYARVLAELDTKIAQGNEEAVFVDPETAANGRKFVGKRTLFEYFVENKKVWMR